MKKSLPFNLLFFTVSLFVQEKPPAEIPDQRLLEYDVARSPESRIFFRSFPVKNRLTAVRPSFDSD